MQAETGSLCGILPDNACQSIAGWHSLPAKCVAVRIGGIELQCCPSVAEVLELCGGLAGKEADSGAEGPYEHEEPILRHLPS